MDYFYQQKLINEKNQLQRQLMEAERKLKSLTEQVGDYDLLVSLLKEGVDLQEIKAFTDEERRTHEKVRALEKHQATRLRALMHSANTGTLRVRSVSLPTSIDPMTPPHHKVVPIDQANKISQTDARARLIAMAQARGMNVIDSGNQIRVKGPLHSGSVVDQTTPMNLQAVPDIERIEAAAKVGPLRRGARTAAAMADREIAERQKRKDYTDSLTIEEDIQTPERAAETAREVRRLGREATTLGKRSDAIYKKIYGVDVGKVNTVGDLGRIGFGGVDPYDTSYPDSVDDYVDAVAEKDRAEARAKREREHPTKIYGLGGKIVGTKASGVGETKSKSKSRKK